MNREHVVPLSEQMVQILKEQEQVCKDFGFNPVWVFPSTQSASGHVHPSALNIALRKIGLKGECSAHGFRAIARTYLARIHVPEKTAEACLAHASNNATVAAYDREIFLEERRKVMQE